MKTSMMEVTPKMAKVWLESNRTNRHPRETHVKYLAQEMASGHWRQTHQGIAFDETGMLIDGQHRLAAIVMVNKTITMPVTFDVQNSNGQFTIIDRGLPRTMSDITGISSPLVSTYNALWNIAMYKDAKRNPDDIKSLHLSQMGRITQKLVNYAPTNTKVFGTAAFRCAVVVSIGQGEDESELFDLYRNLSLNDVDKLPSVGSAAIKLILRDNWLSSRRPITSVYALGMYCSASVNRMKKRIAISAGMRTEYINLAREYLESCLKQGRTK